MSGLFTTLHNASNALRVFERAVGVSQNNVNNASTPGYAKQRLAFEASPFRPEAGLFGGVQAGAVQSARSRYADENVRGHLEALSRFEHEAASLAGIEPAFAVGDSGIPGALNRLFAAFSNWSLTPNSSTARETVLASARDVAQSFQQTAASLARTTRSIDQQLGESVSAINAIAATIRTYNVERLRNPAPDAGLDARLHAALEELSQQVNFTALYQADGTVTVLLDGEVPLVIGERQSDLTLDFFHAAVPPPLYLDAAPGAHLFSADGREVTGSASGGKLGGLLALRNGFLASLQGDTQQVGGLNQLARHVAERVNAILTSGEISAGTPGVPLFALPAGANASAAAQIAVDPNITAAQLAAIDPGPPLVSNGIALRLASLASSSDPADLIAGVNVLDFYSSLAASVGRRLQEANSSRAREADSFAQARALQASLSGVSLDEEAIRLVELQRAYQATARMVSLVDELTQTVIGMLR